MSPRSLTIAVAGPNRSRRTFCTESEMPRETDAGAGIESVVEYRKQALLEIRIEVNEQISTGNEIELRERRILDDVLDCEHHRRPDLLGNPAVVAFFGKEALEPSSRQIGGDSFR